MRRGVPRSGRAGIGCSDRRPRGRAAIENGASPLARGAPWAEMPTVRLFVTRRTDSRRRHRPRRPRRTLGRLVVERTSFPYFRSVPHNGPHRHIAVGARLLRVGALIARLSTGRIGEEVLVRWVIGLLALSASSAMAASAQFGSRRAASQRSSREAWTTVLEEASQRNFNATLE